MANVFALDAGPLGRLAHPTPDPSLVSWLKSMTSGGARIVIPEIADFEIRRSLLQAGLKRSLARLDELSQLHTYMPLNTKSMRLAAFLWAKARMKGKPTAHPHELDCDVILAAQAIEADAIVVTENIGHISLFVTASHWTHIVPPK